MLTLKIRASISAAAMWLLALSATVSAQSPITIGDRFAVILGGAGGQERYTEKYFAQTSQMYEWLVDSLGYNESNIIYLFSEPSFDSLKIDYVSTAKNVQTAFERLSQEMKPEDQLYIFMVGHGTHDGNWSKFNLVGPDLKALDFGKLLSDSPAKKIILVNTASASGPFIQRLSGEGRVIITATKAGTQVYETNYADFFLEALMSDQADFNKDKRVSMREAFTFARTKQDKWFEEERRMRAEHPLLDDNGGGEGSQKLDESEDGEQASRVYLDPISPELQNTLRSLQSGAQTPQDSLLVKKITLEQNIEDLKTQKSQMSSAEYSKQLENLLIELARTNRKLKLLGDRDQ